MNFCENRKNLQKKKFLMSQICKFNEPVFYYGLKVSLSQGLIRER